MEAHCGLLLEYSPAQVTFEQLEEMETRMVVVELEVVLQYIT